MISLHKFLMRSLPSAWSHIGNPPSRCNSPLNGINNEGSFSYCGRHYRCTALIVRRSMFRTCLVLCVFFFFFGKSLYSQCLPPLKNKCWWWQTARKAWWNVFFFGRGGGVTCDALASHTVALLLFTTKTGMSERQLDRSCRSSDDLFLRLVIVGSICTHGDQCTVSFE